MAELKGSNTEKNLQAAFAGESQAFQKYTFYAAAARKAGMNEIADYFEETAHNESAHAKLWFKALHGGDVSSKLTFVMQQLVKTTNTLQCTKISLTKLKKKALQKSLTKCAKLVKSKLVMKLVTLH